MLTVVTEVFGVHGEVGNMVMRPKLLKEQFDTEGTAGICLYFAGKRFNITYKNPQKLTYGEYIIKEAVCDKIQQLRCDEMSVFLDKEQIAALSDIEYNIEIELGKE